MRKIAWMLGLMVLTPFVWADNETPDLVLDKIFFKFLLKNGLLPKQRYSMSVSMPL